MFLRIFIAAFWWHVCPEPQATTWSPTIGQLALSSTSSRVCRGGSLAEGRTLGHFTVLFITPEDMSSGMSHTRTSAHARTHTHTKTLMHPGGIPNSQAEEQLSMTEHIVHTANGWLEGHTPTCTRIRTHAILKETLQHSATTCLVWISKACSSLLQKVELQW